MASALKRKRGPVEALEPSKRTKSAQGPDNSVPALGFPQVGWDPAFGPLKRHNELSAVNGFNSDKVSGTRKSESSEPEDMQDFINKHRIAKAQRKHRKKQVPGMVSSWKISNPIGGRMIDVDPIFTEDEKFLIVSHRKAVQVYSTSNSLLIRSINLSVDQNRDPIVHIVAYVLSPTDPNIIWVASSDGSVYKVDWMSGEGCDRPLKVSSMGIRHMAVASMDSAGQRRDVIFTSEEQDGGWRISAHELSVLGSSNVTQSRVIYTSTQAIQLLMTANEGGIIVAASEERVLLGALRSVEFGTINKIRYEFRIFKSTEFISSMDVRVSNRSLTPSVKASKLGKVSVVDVVVGDVKGAIFVHNDLLGNLIRSQDPPSDGSHAINLIPRKLHWHRKAVHCVKWSLDGNYIISGGSETVMVLWQLDTGRQQYLPHMSAAIHNIVVSPRGTSYAIHLSDNSTMILSTAELIPTANIAGIQAHVIGTSTPLDARVRRLKDEERAKPLISRTQAVINPTNPSRLLLAVGEVQEVNPRSTMVLSAPFLQTFDIAANYNVSRQALTRTNVTNKNITPSAHRIREAVVLHMQISHDGAWLVTVDEWLPPKHDIEFLGHGGMDLEDERRRRREVYLKFWQWNKSDESWALVTRVDEPHTLAVEKYGAGHILALAPDPSSLAFSTLGEDGMVQIWRPRARKRDGVVVRGEDGEPLCTWSCQRQVSLGTAEVDDDALTPGAQIPQHGCLAFSEDGSVLAAAISGRGDGLVHLIDPFIGTIRSSHPVMYRGDLVSIAFLTQYIIILADDLCVYDLVLDERKYAIALGDVKSLLSSEQKAEMMHLAVDRSSCTFAVALPDRHDWTLQERKSVGSLWMAYSEILVFEPQGSAPLYTKALPSLVTALLPAVSSPGFIILDAAAEITTVSPKASQTLTSMAKPVVELRLDIRGEEEEPALDLMQILENTEVVDPDTEASPADPSDAPPPELDDDFSNVVSQHQLSEILDIGPSFALPPIEEMFYQVADLISSKPVAQGTS